MHFLSLKFKKHKMPLNLVVFYYALNFEKVGDILVLACLCVCLFVCVCVCVYGASRYRLETSCMDSSWKNSRHIFLAHAEGSLVSLKYMKVSVVRRPSVCQHFQTTSPLKP